MCNHDEPGQPVFWSGHALVASAYAFTEKLSKGFWDVLKFKVVAAFRIQHGLRLTCPLAVPVCCLERKQLNEGSFYNFRLELCHAGNRYGALALASAIVWNDGLFCPGKAFFIFRV